MLGNKKRGILKIINIILERGTVVRAELREMKNTISKKKKNKNTM